MRPESKLVWPNMILHLLQVPQSTHADYREAAVSVCVCMHLLTDVCVHLCAICDF